MSATKLLNKLSFKTVGASGKMTVFGTVNNTKVKPTQYGDAVALVGRFNAFADDARDVIFNSPICYLPDLATNLIVSALDSNDGAEIEFAFVIEKQIDTKSTVGYVYSVQPIIAQRDPLAELQAKVLASLPAMLPAPVIDDAGETPAKPAKNGAK